ncbi:D-alanyl-D-alanine carboxypeptidase [Streptomyces kronopolitis]|uniref:D-alanyl-D-alanine carboxypeptidase n=1 Tax=Streptomyces kronopolitis TaxID=1612435 RepID=UPI0020BD6FFB|nr:serine hydrolase [Streptomyces kronopolitis]MCL6296830.1 D-alanyl-D-alanine carboxypeptidase [Streptomyces kronopolitis]
MKETSVAGESPDKSDKKQSSGETARSERDPRLSAFRREPDEPAKKQEPGAGEDARPEEDGSKKDGPKKDGSNGPKSAAQGVNGAKSSAGSKAKPKSEESASGKPKSEKSASGKSASAEAAEAAGGAKAVEPSEGEAAGSSEASAGSGASEAAEASQGAAEGDGGGGGGDDRLRAAVAAWVAGTDDEAEGDAGAKGDGAEGDGDAAAAEESKSAAAGADAKPKSDAKSKPRVEPKPDAEPDAKAEVKPDAKSQAKAEPEPEPESEEAASSEAGAGAASVPRQAGAVDQPTAVFKTTGARKGKPAGADGKGSKADEGKDSGDGDDADEAPVDDATRVFAIAKLKGKGAAAESVDQATTAFKINPQAKAKDEDAAKGKPGSTGKADAKEDPKAKDEPKAKEDPKSTAEAKDASDGDGGAGAKKDGDAKGDTKKDGDAEKGAGGKAKGAPERDSERTSQFVALKSADDGTAGRSLGKTAPKTPARTPDKASDKASDKTDDKAEGKAAEKPADKASEKPADKPSGKGAGTGTSSGAAAAKSAGAADGKAAEKPTQKSAEKPAAKAPGAPPAAKPAAAPSAEATGASAAAGLTDSERTKQEPLPPLDLLAQLTNTPPPAETPLRTVVRRFKIWTPLAVLLAIVFVVAQAVRPLPNPTLTVGDAKSSFTFEGGKLTIPWPDQGQAAIKVVGSGDLGTFGPQKPVPTASVAKIMTAYVILRDHPLKKDEKGPQIKVDAKAVAEGGSTNESRIEGLKAGQKFSQQDMLKMLMIPSGNNIARLLARWDTNSDKETAFVKKMNAAAKELGMKNTTYTDPSGLDPKTVSTAVDQLKLAEAVMKFDAFRPIVAMTNADIPGLPERINSNIDNLLLAGLSIKGIKTGSSTAAGGTLSWAAYKTVDGKDRLILGTMMDQHFKGLDPNGSNSLTLVKNNSQKVIEAVRDALNSATAVKKGQVVGYVDDGLNGRTPVVATKDLKAVGVPGQKLELSVGDGGKTIPHTAKAGTEVGMLTVGNGQSMQKVPVALQKDLVEPSFGAKLVRIG